MRPGALTIAGGIAAADAAALILSLAAAAVAAAWLTPILGTEPLSAASKLVDDRISSLLPALGVFASACHARRHYAGRNEFWGEARGVLAAVGLAVLAEGFLQFAARNEASRLWTACTWAIVPFAVVALRTAAKTAFIRAGHMRFPVLVVGRQFEASRAADALTSDPLMGYCVAAVHDGDGDLRVLFERSGAKGVVVALSEGGDGRYSAIARDLARLGIPFSVAVPPTGLATTLTRPQTVFGHDVTFLEERAGLTRRPARIAKRLIDVAAAGAALLVLAPALAVVAAAVRRDGGPAFFSHGRVGAGGARFLCHKFRTMRVDAAEALAAHLAADPAAAEEWRTARKLADDPRITPLGRFLRKTSIDELPQLWNVLVGEMSLVGPRPVTEDELVEHYADERRTYELTRPGVTGLWQATGRNAVGYERRVALDGWYVRNWSAWLDLVLVLKTVPVLVTRRGAS